MWSHTSKVDLDFGACTNRFILRTSANTESYIHDKRTRQKVPDVRVFPVSSGLHLYIEVVSWDQERELRKMVVING